MDLSRRGFLMGAAGLLAAPALAQGHPALAYVTPMGGGDGSSWDNAASLNQIGALIARVGPGGSILLNADLGPYEGHQDVIVSRGGRAGASVQISGASYDGSPRRAEFIGTRRLWSPPANESGAVDASRFGGGTLFRLTNGASHLRFANMSVKHFGRMLDMSGQRASDIVIEDIDFINLRDGVYTDPDSAVTDVLIRRFNGTGFSKKAVRFRGDCSNWRVEDCEFDSAWQYGDDFAVAIEAYDNAHDLHVIGGFTRNCWEMHSDPRLYWNADGIASERFNYNILIENHTSTGNTDGGYDLKSERTTLRNCFAENNKRNYRIWGGIKDGPIIMEGCHSINPVLRGGIGTMHHIWLAGYYEPDEKWGGANVICSNGVLSGGTRGDAAIFVNGQDASIRLVDTDISRIPEATELFTSVRDPDQTSRLIIG